MANFNWLNALPVRDWSEPDRDWRVLRLTREGFLKRSQIMGDEPLEAAFHAWAAQQLHRNYVVAWDDVPAPGELIFIAMKENVRLGSEKRTNVSFISRKERPARDGQGNRPR